MTMTFEHNILLAVILHEGEISKQVPRVQVSTRVPPPPKLGVAKSTWIQVEQLRFRVRYG